MKKECEIYKIRKTYKIVTLYQVDSGVLTSREPIFILPIESDIEELKSCIFESLNSSKKISYSNYYSNGSSKELLKKMKEQSFKYLYNNSTSCNIFLENNCCRITPLRRRIDRGLEGVGERSVEIVYTPDKEMEITKKIIEMLEIDYNV